MKLQKNKGITLIALIITIIVLFILAVISVATLTGENGLLNKANVAKEESKKAEYKEELELIGQELQIEQKTKNITDKEYMDKYKEKIRNNERFKDAQQITRKDNETILLVTTKEGYVYKVTKTKVDFIGKQGGTAPPDLKQSDIEGICDPDDWTNGEVKVTVKVNNKELSKYTIQYSLDGKTNWKTYTEPITFKDNGSLFVRLQNELLEFGGATTINVANIDKLAPKNATIKLSTTSLGIGQSVQATVTHTDEQADSKNAQSGINISKCKWEYNTTSEYIGTDESSYKGTFSNNDQILSREFTTIGTYYLHVLTTDNAGNKNETISEAIKVTGNLSSQVNVGDYVDYKAGTHSYTSKKGTGTTGGTGYDTPQTFTSNDDIKWRVLSKENNEVVLISEGPIQTNDNKNFYLNGAIGYLYAEEELNKICSIYGYGVGANTSKPFSYEVGDVVEGVEQKAYTGSGARSITVEDVNKICGVTPSTAERNSGYGEEYTKSMYYPTRTEATGYSTSAASRKYKNTSYGYTGIDKIENQYKMLFRNEGDTGDIIYWLASRCESDIANLFENFSVCWVHSGNVESAVIGIGGSRDFSESSRDDVGVRPVVYLKSNIQTSGKDSSGAWTIIE